MYRDNSKCICPAEYARAYIKPQPYENLFSVEEAFTKGTIFKSLYMPYKENKNWKSSNCNRRCISEQ